MRILFRIPFTWYFLAKSNSIQKECVTTDKKELFCLATKQWDSKNNRYYFIPVN